MLQLLRSSHLCTAFSYRFFPSHLAARDKTVHRKKKLRRLMLTELSELSPFTYFLTDLKRINLSSHSIS